MRYKFYDWNGNMVAAPTDNIHKSIWEQKKLDFIERGIPEAVANSMIPEMSPKETMYIISNGVKEYGAIYMFSEEGLSSVAERVGTNLYILPSSTHEVIAISTDSAPAAEFIKIVHDANKTLVQADEVLSENIYHFDIKTKELSIVTI